MMVLFGERRRRFRYEKIVCLEKKIWGMEAFLLKEGSGWGEGRGESWLEEEEMNVPFRSKWRVLEVWFIRGGWLNVRFSWPAPCFMNSRFSIWALFRFRFRMLTMLETTFCRNVFSKRM